MRCRSSVASYLLLLRLYNCLIVRVFYYSFNWLPGEISRSTFIDSADGWRQHLYQGYGWAELYQFAPLPFRGPTTAPSTDVTRDRLSPTHTPPPSRGIASAKFRLFGGSVYYHCSRYGSGRADCGVSIGARGDDVVGIGQSRANFPRFK